MNTQTPADAQAQSEPPLIDLQQSTSQQPRAGHHATYAPEQEVTMAGEQGSADPTSYVVAPVRTAEEREAVFAVRMIVFVEEQNVPPGQELDALDVTAVHFVARRTDLAPDDTTGVVGTARLLDKGEGKAKIGRVAVLQAHRGRGVGALLMRAVEEYARQRGFTYLALDAQCYAIPFYEKLGYAAQGDIFLDCDIEHRYMSRPLVS